MTYVPAEEAYARAHAVCSNGSGTGIAAEGASTASACLDDLTAKLTDAQAELAAAQDKAEASSAEVLMLAKAVNEAAEVE